MEAEVIEKGMHVSMRSNEAIVIMMMDGRREGKSRSGKMGDDSPSDKSDR